MEQKIHKPFRFKRTKRFKRDYRKLQPFEQAKAAAVFENSKRIPGITLLKLIRSVLLAREQGRPFNHRMEQIAIHPRLEPGRFSKSLGVAGVRHSVTESKLVDNFFIPNCSLILSVLSKMDLGHSTGRYAAAMLVVLSGLLGDPRQIAAAEGEFVNLSTRAYVETGEKVTIGGFIIQEGARKVVIHAIGPELANRGVSEALADPVLRVIDTTDPANFRELMVNDDWNDSQGQELSDIWGSALPFTADSKSSAAVLTLEPGNYTAIVEGKDGTSGIALVEVWKINPPDSGRPDREFFTAVYRLYGVMAGYYWSINFGEAGITYQNIGTLEGYDTPILTPCGQLGLNNAFYCSINQGIYYDMGFFEEYEVQDEPVAPAVIIAHEFGHHVSWLLDLWEVNTRKQEELQADCFAGAWTRSAHDYFEATPEELRQAVLLMYELGHPEYT